MTEPRPKLTMQVLMVGIAYAAIFLAGVLATINDPSRPDFFMASYVVGIAGMIIPRLMAGRGRDLAAYWGFAITTLTVMLGLLVFYQVQQIRNDSGTSMVRTLSVDFGPPWLAIGAGYLGAWVVRRRFDQKTAPDPVS